MADARIQVGKAVLCFHTSRGRVKSRFQLRYDKSFSRNQRLFSFLTSSAEAGASVLKMVEVSRHKSIEQNSNAYVLNDRISRLYPPADRLADKPQEF
jgi:hypothetical protein